MAEINEKLVNVTWENGLKSVLRESVANIFAGRGKLKIEGEAKTQDVEAPETESKESKESKETNKTPKLKK
jgi:hypothetical protein